MPTINTNLEPDLPGLVQAMKHDILELVRNGRVPPDVQNFAQLHDHCDANCLGGLCTNEKFNALIAKFGGRDENEGLPQGMLDIITEAQDAITAWIQDGGIATTPALSMVQNQPIQPTV